MRTLFMTTQRAEKLQSQIRHIIMNLLPSDTKLEILIEESDCQKQLQAKDKYIEEAIKQNQHLRKYANEKEDEAITLQLENKAHKDKEDKLRELLKDGVDLPKYIILKILDGSDE